MLDVDICGPSIPKVMGLEGEQVHILLRLTKINGKKKQQETFYIVSQALQCLKNEKLQVLVALTAHLFHYHFSTAFIVTK